jgi:NAD(P)-dependent dehydrogenase (short-subunit alcohol dehydrogenase family)
VTNRLVIGAASGMGEAVARRFAHATAAGDRLLLADISAESLETLAGELGAEYIRCDITSDSDVEAVARHLGDIDAAALTAGLSPTMATGRTILDVNLAGAARVAETLLPRMRAGGALVCFSSSAGHLIDSTRFNELLDEPRSAQLYDALLEAGAALEDPGFAYGVSKYGVRRYVGRAAAAWGARDARIVSLSPGIIETPMGAREFAQQPFMKTLVEMTPLKRQGSADEVAAVACFLVSPEASFVTGVDLLVDGGSVSALGIK